MAKQIVEDLNYVRAVLGTRPFGYVYNTNKVTAHEIIKFGMFTYLGRFCYPKTKSLGAGVYGIYITDSDGKVQQ